MRTSSTSARLETAAPPPSARLTEGRGPPPLRTALRSGKGPAFPARRASAQSPLGARHGPSSPSFLLFFSHQNPPITGQNFFPPEPSSRQECASTGHASGPRFLFFFFFQRRRAPSEHLRPSSIIFFLRDWARQISQSQADW